MPGPIIGTDLVPAAVFQWRCRRRGADLLRGLVQQPDDRLALRRRAFAEVSGSGMDLENKMSHLESRRRSVALLARVNPARVVRLVNRIGRELVRSCTLAGSRNGR